MQSYGVRSKVTKSEIWQWIYSAELDEILTPLQIEFYVLNVTLFPSECSVWVQEMNDLYGERDD